MTKRKNALNWFEIYVTDFDRAKRFYETILVTSLQEVGSATKDGSRKAVFPHENMKGIGGLITNNKDIAPGAGGTIIYLNVEGDLDGVIKRIPKAGGSVIKPKTSVGEHGFIAIFTDTEGNRVGLHSVA